MKSIRHAFALAIAAVSSICLTTPIANAQSWTQTATPPGGSVWAMAQIGSYTFAGTTSGGIYRSTNYGGSWTQTGPAGAKVRSLHQAVSGPLVVGLDGLMSNGLGLMYSTIDGVNWTQVFGPNSSLGQIHAITSGYNSNNTTFYIAGTNQGVIRSTTGNPGTWVPSNTGLSPNGGNLPMVRALATTGSTVYAGTYGQGVFRSTDGGLTWTNIGRAGKYVQTLLISGTSVYAGEISGPDGVAKLTGSTWTVINAGLPLSSNNGFRDVWALHRRGTKIYAGYELGTAVSQIGISGTIWTAAGSGLATPNSGRSFASRSCVMFAGTDIGVWRWFPSPNGCPKSAQAELAPGALLKSLKSADGSE